MLAAESRVVLELSEPYPGLRAFEPKESLLFFGRRAHTEALLERLADCRFLAVVGTSGSGKSSLVRAGLVPALYRGHLAGASSRWRIALMRPGESPLRKLADAISAALPEGNDPGTLQQTLGKSSLGLIQAVRARGLAPLENVLLVVDQFEEIFRFRGARRNSEREAESALFVSSLLEAVNQICVPIYVVLTMRSDFLGDCARFHGLPEALNHSQYLIPQLTRAQRQEAIEGPLRVAGVSISPALVQRVLNEAGEEPDQLPVLQHALMRTFRLWKNRGGSGPIGVEDYDSAGCMAEALDRHASEVFEALPDDEHRLMTEKVFRCLTTVEKGRAVRRPTSLESIFGVTGASGARGQEVVRNVIRRFAAKENSFLLSSTAQDLGPGSIIDISHESLIAKWTLLGAWVMQEVKVVECYRYLSRDAALYPLAAGLWRDPELSYALEFFQSGECNDAWSRQYEESNTASYRETLQFLEESQRVQREENEREELRRKKEIEDARKLAAAEARAKRWLGGAALLLFLLLLTTGVVFWLYGASVRSREIERERVLLREQLSSAQSQANDARGRIASLEAAGGESAAELERLRRQVAQSEIEAKQAQAALRSSVPPSASAASPAPQQVDKRAESLISSLQEQLRVARQERDDAYGKLDAVAKGPLPGSEPSLDQDLESANRRVRYLESKLASARLGAAVLPENSLVPLTETPYRGRVAFLVGDLSAAGKAIPVRVLVAQSGMLPRGFEGDPKMASKYLGVAKVSCPGYAEVRGLTVYCFLLPTTVATRPEEIGRFWLDKEEVSLVALGLAQKPSGDYGKGSTVVSLVAFPAPQERALSKK